MYILQTQPGQANEDRFLSSPDLINWTQHSKTNMENASVFNLDSMWFMLDIIDSKFYIAFDLDVWEEIQYPAGGPWRFLGIVAGRVVFYDPASGATISSSNGFQWIPGSTLQAGINKLPSHLNSRMLIVSGTPATWAMTTDGIYWTQGVITADPIYSVNSVPVYMSVDQLLYTGSYYVAIHKVFFGDQYSISVNGDSWTKPKPLAVGNSFWCSTPGHLIALGIDTVNNPGYISTQVSYDGGQSFTAPFNSNFNYATASYPDGALYRPDTLRSKIYKWCTNFSTQLDYLIGKTVDGLSWDVIPLPVVPGFSGYNSQLVTPNDQYVMVIGGSTFKLSSDGGSSWVDGTFPVSGLWVGLKDIGVAHNKNNFWRNFIHTYEVD